MSGRNAVTRLDCMSRGDEYTYDANVGNIGGFHYYTVGSSEPNFTLLLKPANIGACVDTQFTITPSDIQKIFHTTIDLPGVPLGTPYGWSHDFDCWAYFTKGMNEMATHTSAFA